MFGFCGERSDIGLGCSDGFEDDVALLEQF
jgi:hypothetical protein